MFSISFIFKPGTDDDEFRRLDAATQAVAESTEGYYWADLAHLSDFAQATTHRAAKSAYDRWYDGYHGNARRGCPRRPSRCSIATPGAGPTSQARGGASTHHRITAMHALLS